MGGGGGAAELPRTVVKARSAPSRPRDLGQSLRCPGPCKQDPGALAASDQGLLLQHPGAPWGGAGQPLECPLGPGHHVSSGWRGSAPRRSPHRSPAPIPRGAVKGVPREPPPQVPASHQPLCHVAAPSLGAAGPRHPPGSRCWQVSFPRLSRFSAACRGDSVHDCSAGIQHTGPCHARPTSRSTCFAPREVRALDVFFCFLFFIRRVYHHCPLFKRDLRLREGE